MYLVLFIAGLVVDHDSSANFVPVNGAANWLHLGAAVAMIASAPHCAAPAVTAAGPWASVTGQSATPRGPAL